jgi:hypothetical protein
MQTILHLLRQAGGWHPGLYLQIENQPHMALVIEASDASFERACAAGAHPKPYYCG